MPSVLKRYLNDTLIAYSKSWINFCLFSLRCWMRLSPSSKKIHTVSRNIKSRIKPLAGWSVFFNQNKNFGHSIRAGIHHTSKPELWLDFLEFPSLIHSNLNSYLSIEIRNAGFLAHLSGGTSVSGVTALKFDAIIYDYGSNYNPTTGVYTCPHNGTYLIATQVYGTDNNGAHYIK